MEKREIVLKVTKVEQDWGTEYIVKRGRSIEAKISAPNKYCPDEFKISKSGMAFYRPTLETALEYVRNSVEGFANAFGTGAEWTVKMEEK